MSNLKGALLTDRTVVTASGPDAEGFLQGLVTADVAAIGESQGRLAAILSPQGKVLFDFLLVRREGGFVIDCRADMAADLVKRLGFYKLRAKVELADAGDSLGVIALWGDELPPIEGAFADPRHRGMGLRVLAGSGDGEAALRAVGAQIVPLAAYHAHRVHVGVGEGGADFVLGDTFPHEANMDLFGGVSFSKGCYVGQEVVSRMEHRGTARTRLVAVRLGGEAAAGSEITAGGKAIGRLGSVAGEEALALLRLDRAGEVMEQGDKLSAGGAQVSPRDGGTFEPAGGAN